MTPEDAIDALDQAAAELVRGYGNLGKVAALVRTDDGIVRIVTLASNNAGIAKLLFAAADTFADRAFEDKQCKPKSTN